MITLDNREIKLDIENRNISVVFDTETKLEMQELLGGMNFKTLKEACEAYGVTESAYGHARRRHFNETGEYLTLIDYVNRNKKVNFRGKWYKSEIAVAKEYGATYDKYKRESEKEGFTLEKFISDIESGKLNKRQSTVVNGKKFKRVQDICDFYGINKGSYYQAKRIRKHRGEELTIQDYVRETLRNRGLLTESGTEMTPKRRGSGRLLGEQRRKPVTITIDNEIKKFGSIREACNNYGLSATAFNTYKGYKLKENPERTIDDIFEEYVLYKREKQARKEQKMKNK